MATIFDPFGAPQWGLADCKVAKNNLNGTFGTAVDVPSIQLFNVQWQTVNSELTGDDKITATHAKVIGGTATIRFGSVALDVLAVLTNLSVGSSGSNPNRRRHLRLTNQNMQYFALCGKANAVEGDGDFHMFVPLAKIMEGFSTQMEYGAFLIPDIQCRFLLDDNYFSGVGVEWLEYETAHNVVIPPVFP